MVFVSVLRLVYMMSLYLEPIVTTACIHTKPSNFKGWTARIFNDLEKILSQINELYKKVYEQKVL